MNDFNQFRDKISELVNVWKKVIEPEINKSGQYGETNTRKYLIDPILEALNWVDDGSKKVIDNEFAIKHKTGTGSADYALKINGVPSILLEAKDVAKIKDLENGYDVVHGVKRTYPMQLSNYCHDLNANDFDIKFSILTNGKEWIIYNMQYSDVSSDREVVFRLDLNELDKTENLQKLWAFEYDDFCNGHNRLREIIQDLHDSRFDIDKKAVQQLLECKDLLSNSILSDYKTGKGRIKRQIDDILEDKEKINGMPIFKEIPIEERFNLFIKEASSSIINKILFIRILEDKNFLTPKLTKRSIEKWKDFWGHKDYGEIMNLFREACKFTENTYNGGLFRLNPYDLVEYDPNVIKKIIAILGDINFREIDSDIIGRIYEIYLGQVLKIESEIQGKKVTKYKADNRGRKKLGQYYTPKFVVDFIVKNTLGKTIEGKTPEEVAKIRILDPACGSGSFLINTYDTLVEYYEDWNTAILKKINEENKNKGAKLSKYQENGMIPNHKNIILKENIYGVDLNDLSVQICEINLWLRALERDKKLIKLNKNILHGNSLITGVEGDEELSFYTAELEEIKKKTNEIKDYYDKDELNHEEQKRLEALELRLKVLKNKINEKLNENLKDYFDEHLNRVQPFNWEVEIPQVMQEGGFDVVVGNPPWISFGLRNVGKLAKGEQNYYRKHLSSVAEYKLSTYALFIERAINLLKDGGRFSFILPDSFLVGRYFSKLRKFILDTCCIKEILFFEWDVFSKEASTGRNVILILQKEKNEEKRLKNEIKVLRCGEIDRIGRIENLEIFFYGQIYFDKMVYNRFRLFFNKDTKNFVEKVERESGILKDYLTGHTGVRSLTKQKEIISKNKNGDNWKKGLVSGGQVTKYHVEYQGDYINIDPLKLNKGGWDPNVIENDKIFIRQTGDRIIAALDTSKLYHLNNVHSFSPNKKALILKYY